MSRYLVRDVIEQRFGRKLEKFQSALAREGPYFLFSLRLIPAAPFFLINVMMGLTPIHTWTFWWVSQLGMLAGTIVYVYAGASVPDLHVLADQGINAVFSPSQLGQIVAACVLLGSFPLAMRWSLKRLIVAKPSSRNAAP
jgi:uncharacterized membrane protein YdjX (TVP38/TMEM64 family)